MNCNDSKRSFFTLESLSYLRAVHIEPPITDEVLLVKQSTIRTKEAVLGEVFTAKVGTDVESLALSFWISVVTLYVSITEETRARRSGVDGIIFSWGAGDGVGESRNGIFFFLCISYSKQSKTG